jgi:uncharacterized protein (DUF433 family)
MEVDAYIHSDPGILCGKPVVRGTRLSVEFLLELIALGWTEQQILGSYPRLSRAGLDAVLASSRRL